LNGGSLDRADSDSPVRSYPTPAPAVSRTGLNEDNGSYVGRAAIDELLAHHEVVEEVVERAPGSPETVLDRFAWFLDFDQFGSDSRGDQTLRKGGSPEQVIDILLATYQS